VFTRIVPDLDDCTNQDKNHIVLIMLHLATSAFRYVVIMVMACPPKLGSLKLRSVN